MRKPHQISIKVEHAHQLQCRRRMEWDRTRGATITPCQRHASVTGRMIQKLQHNHGLLLYVFDEILCECSLLLCTKQHYTVLSMWIQYGNPYLHLHIYLASSYNQPQVGTISPQRCDIIMCKSRTMIWQVMVQSWNKRGFTRHVTTTTAVHGSTKVNTNDRGLNAFCQQQAAKMQCQLLMAM